MSELSTHIQTTTVAGGDNPLVPVVGGSSRQAGGFSVLHDDAWQKGST